MAQKHIQIYDDSVLKLSIKQGVESDRFQSDNIDATSIVHKSTSTLPGAFTMGELAYTRDTNRVFVGNFTNEKEFLYGSELASENNGQIIQQTVGGTLVGNKYLGYVDSKPPYNNDERVSKPLSLSENTTFTINGEKTVENGVLVDGSKFRSYEFGNTADDKSCVLTEDGKWSRQSYYNPKYDAYDGDYMYDIYRNALILFDHNIKPSNSELPQPGESKNSRQHSHIGPIETDNKADSTKTVYDHTVDMYGDGYVCLYNIIPDGDTLTFNAKDFSNTTGIANDSNYTQNVVSVQKIYAGAMVSALDPNVFQTNINKEDKEEKIRLQTTQTFEKINLPENISEETKKYLVLPNNLGLDGNVCIDFSKFNVSTSDSKSYKLKFTYTGENLEGYQDTKHLQAEFVDDSAVPRYTLMLGRGLETFEGENTLFFDSDNVTATLQLSGASSSGALTDNPFNLPHVSSDNLYTSNLVTSVAGCIISENKYAEKYADAAAKIIKKYDSENTKLNYLVQSTPILSASSTVTDHNFKFRVTPVVYNAVVDTSLSGVNTVGISSNKITITNKINPFHSKSHTLHLDNYKDIWVYCNDGEFEKDPDYYTSPSGNKCIRISHPVKGVMTYYGVSGKTDANYEIYTLMKDPKNEAEAEAEKKLIFSEQDDVLQASIITSVIEDNENKILEEIKIQNIKSLYSPTTGDTYENIKKLSTIFDKDEENNSITITKYITNDLSLTECFRFEVETEDKKILISIPTEKYVTTILRETVKAVDETDDDIVQFTCDDLSEAYIKSITLYTINEDGKGDDENDHHAQTVYSNEENAENKLTDLITKDGITFIDESIIFSGEPNSNSYKCVCMMTIEDTDGKTITYNFINNNYKVEELKSDLKLYVEEEYGISESDADYYFYGSEEAVKVNLYDTNTIIRDTEYGISNEYNIDGLFDEWAFYYKEVDKKFICLSGKTDEDEGYDEDVWLEQRRINLMNSFPIIPSHASSVILECKTGSDASLKLYHVGNSKTPENIVEEDYEDDVVEGDEVEDGTGDSNTDNTEGNITEEGGTTSYSTTDNGETGDTTNGEIDNGNTENGSEGDNTTDNGNTEDDNTTDSGSNEENNDGTDNSGDNTGGTDDNTSSDVDISIGTNSDILDINMGNLGSPSKFKIEGLNFSTSLTGRNNADWTKDKPLLDIGPETTSYVELPISIDRANNKHFTFKLNSTGKVLISLAAYRV